MSFDLFVLPSSEKKNKTGEMDPRAGSLIQPDNDVCTTSARIGRFIAAAGSRANDRLRRSADGVNSPGGDLQMRSSSSAPLRTMPSFVDARAKEERAIDQGK